MTRATRSGAFVALLVTIAGSAGSAVPPGGDPLELGRRYVEDAAFRRQVLERSLVNPDNDYSRLRLAHYRDDDWGALPEWNPPVSAIARGGMAGEYRRIDVDSVPWDHDALVALGHEAFFNYPAQLQDAIGTGVAHPDRYGLWTSAEHVGGVVREQLKVGPPRLAVSCSTCHAMTGPDGALIPGRPNSRLDISAMLTDAFGGAGPVWGPGRIDLTDDGLDNPATIADLRSVRSERYLHHDATLRNGLIELAIRIETGFITSNKRTIRPPRKLAFALALYLWELQPTAIASPDAASRRGAVAFRKQCASCHRAPDYSGEPVPLARIGTNPSVGLSRDRTTGTYRVPSLRGVGDRTPLLAAGGASTLEALLDPSRPSEGHRYGLKLSADGRRDLIAFLRTLR